MTLEEWSALSENEQKAMMRHVLERLECECANCQANVVNAKRVLGHGAFYGIIQEMLAFMRPRS